MQIQQSVTTLMYADNYGVAAEHFAYGFGRGYGSGYGMSKGDGRGNGMGIEHDDDNHDGCGNGGDYDYGDIVGSGDGHGTENPHCTRLVYEDNIAFIHCQQVMLS